MSNAPFAVHAYDTVPVIVSLLLAALASYQALELTGRVRRHGVRRSTWLLVAGALTFGTGVWAMHFVSMLGFHVGTPLGYAWQETAVSWVLAVLSAGLGIFVATQRRPTMVQSSIAAVAIAAAISGMHYVGMDALVMYPAVQWRWPLVALSVAVALAASCAALWAFFRMRTLRGRRRRVFHVTAAVLMAGAIAGMHYIGMAAMDVPGDALCLTVNGLHGDPMAYLIGAASAVIVIVGWLLSRLDQHHARRETGLSNSLAQAQDDLRQQALLDALTRLPNRLLFDDRLSNAIARRQRRKSDTAEADGPRQCLAVITIDLDGFQLINEIFGHATGDEILIAAARRLQEHLRAGDTLARLGADEFGLILECEDPEANAVQLSERVGALLSDQFDIDGRELSLSSAIGIALYPRHATDSSRLLACAESATREAKRQGGSTYAFYRPTMASPTDDIVELQSDLRKAVTNGELCLHYQPKIDTRTQTVHGAEALLRWTHPRRGPISPAVFIPIAERFGLMGAIGHWVIDQACAQLRQWNDHGLRMRVAVNISPQQLRSPDLPQQVIEILRKYRLDPSQLVCEVTESCMMENIATAQASLLELGRSGSRISIDDFGTGYSSLSHLRHLPATQIKIDRSFLADIETNTQARSLVDAIVRLAKALNLEVVAEGVETEFQRAALTAAGCDVLQGFYFAKPMPADQLQRWMAERDLRSASQLQVSHLGLPATMAASALLPSTPSH